MPSRFGVVISEKVAAKVLIVERFFRLFFVNRKITRKNLSTKWGVHP
jgi:hypothetical protein